MDGERDNLVPIGRFAFLTGLSRRALRFYDERGLLRPARVDEWTGYRFYSLEQLPTAELISSLREVDMPLDEIKRALAEPCLLGGLLDRHEVRLRERIEECERALALLPKLREKKEKELVTLLSTEVREVPVLHTACVEIHTGVDRIGNDVGPVCGRLFEALKAAGLSPAGPGLIGYPEEDFDPESFRALIAFPVDADVSGVAGVEAVEFAGGKAVVGVVRGPYDNLQQAWQQVVAWIADQGLQISAMPYEVYRIDHRAAPSPDELETDIVVPVA
jgi:DNA-binding transcriptional MerR regulator/predicted transcriptional regulator YdeE